MTREPLHRIDEVFQGALEQPAPEREAFIARACGGDEDLRQAVARLLASHERARAEKFLETPEFERSLGLAGRDTVCPAPGDKVGRYRVIDRIGAGRMSQVFVARDDSLGRRVALKLLPGALTWGGERLRRLRRESLAASALNHPNIVAIHEVGQWRGNAFIATELIEGMTLRRSMEDEALRLERALELGAQVASALSAAHAADIVHGDVKPENVLVGRDGLVKVLDFGIARYREPVDGGPEARTWARTQANVVAGFMAYMSPEQVRGLEANAPTDVWALGCVLFEMLAGRAAFGRKTAPDTIMAVLEREPDWNALGAAVPSRARCLLERCLAKEVDHRDRDATRARLDLEEALAECRRHPAAALSRTLHERPARRPAPRQRILRIGAACLAAGRAATGRFAARLGLPPE